MGRLAQFRRLLWKTILDTLDYDCIGFAKEAAYSFVLTFFPLLLFFVAAFAALGSEQTGVILSGLQRIMPPGTFSVVEAYLQQLMQGRPGQVALLSFFATLLPAIGLIATLSRALDRIYNISPRRSFWREQLLCLELVFVVGLPLVLVSVAGVVGAHLESIITRLSGGSLTFGYVWAAARWVFIVMSVFLIQMLLYRLAPSRPPRWRHILPGAVFATTLWGLATFGFGIYVANFSAYGRIYGSIGTVIVLLVWMYVIAFVFLVGAVFNRRLAILELERQLEALSPADAQSVLLSAVTEEAGDEEAISVPGNPR
ncbi:MAG: YihY/virulence factor BrkB family protein [Chloracidobacterium sp.]|uniref:YihY/virulence factor BrkB family protein n=1 Tax=Chloracidobacterium validum TaxID=2821543 RepID=A0ABX8B5Z7_9BACT|nr:YihY/virulence factor BrkB family protein [Chloracidobacterium validum]QUW02394.1 YihY/virulence factor BrkB family protein [Chloracidobacterium validum]